MTSLQFIVIFSNEFPHYKLSHADTWFLNFAIMQNLAAVTPVVLTYFIRNLHEISMPCMKVYAKYYKKKRP